MHRQNVSVVNFCLDLLHIDPTETLCCPCLCGKNLDDE
ncbi:MAG: hypothetical protein OFPI_21440 [Osedax symbiont Rs2]|nr:MAG: hypothetical protein OFPI_21440 [Osedax symbiont Rs2]